MNWIGRSLSVFVLAGSLAAAGTVTASSAPVGRAPADARACALGAEVPKPGSNNTLSGVGSRSGCGSSRVTLTVKVWKHLAARPDKLVGSRVHRQFGNGIMTVVAGCDGSGKYYTETVSSSGNTIKSATRELC